jgi:type I restriction enzyme S subunit
MNGWRECKLGDIAQIVDCEHKTAPLVEKGDFISVRTTDINNGKINFDIANRISEQTYIEWTKRIIPREEDIVLAREAPVGEVGWVDSKHKICLGQRTVLIRPDSEKVDSRYLLYYLASKDAKQELINQSAGSVVQHLNVKNIREFDLRVCDYLPEQRSIASVLSSLDDKIDLLHRQNKTLEAMAETLFRQWFVEEAEEDWEMKEIREIAEKIQYGFTQSATLESIGPKFLRITDIQGGAVSWGNVPYCSATEEQTQKYLISSGDIVVARTGASTGENIFIQNPPRAVFASYLVRLQFSNIALSRYVAIHMRSAGYFDYIEGILSGSAQPNANAQQLTSFRIQIPPQKLLKKFYEVIEEFDKKQNCNEQQIATLSCLRDILLPKLMSGEVRVSSLSRGHE